MAREGSARGRQARQQAALDGWLSTKSSPNTRAAYRSDLEAFGTWCARRGTVPLTADTATIVAFQAAREAAGDSDSTIRRRWSALSSFYDFAVARELRTTNPAATADRPKVRAGDPSPTVQLSEAAVTSYRAGAAAALDPRLDALVALLVSDGLKVAEALALDIDDVSGRPPAMTVVLRRRGETRRVVLDRASARAVRRCIAQRRTGPVFVNERSAGSDEPSRLTRFGADHLIRQLRTDDPSEQVTANALRRFHITAGQLGGSDLEAVRDRAGLAHVRGVRRFVDAPPDEPVTADPTASSPPRRRRAAAEPTARPGHPDD